MEDSSIMNSLRNSVEGFGTTCSNSVKNKTNCNDYEINRLEEELNAAADRLREELNRQIDGYLQDINIHKPSIGTSQGDPNRADYMSLVQKGTTTMKKMTDWLISIFIRIKEMIKSIIQKVKEKFCGIIEFIRKEFNKISGEPI
jgi:hypothetical protein